MATTTSTTDRDVLLAEQKRLRTCIKKCNERAMAYQRTINTIDRKLHRLKIIEIQGVEDGVCVRWRGKADRKFDDATGMVIHVRRTKATVDFGDLGQWQFPIEWLLPVTERKLQGEFVALN